MREYTEIEKLQERIAILQANNENLTKTNEELAARLLEGERDKD